MITKIKALLIHLLISAVIVGLLILMIVFIWYPKPLFEISGVITPVKMLVFIDLIVGPILTFVVYKKHKKTLKFDLSIVALMQIIALCYGAYIINNGRANLLVMSAGKLTYMVEKYAHNDRLAFDELKPHIFSGPKLAYADESIAAMSEADFYAQIKPINDYYNSIIPYSFSEVNMKANYPNKIKDIDFLMNKYKNDNIVFVLLNKDTSTHYVIFSRKQNRIIDYLRF